MQKRFKGCTIQNVVWQEKLPRLGLDVLDANGEAHAVSIQNWNVSEQIAELLNGIR